MTTIHKVQIIYHPGNGIHFANYRKATACDTWDADYLTNPFNQHNPYERHFKTAGEAGAFCREFNSGEHSPAYYGL